MWCVLKFELKGWLQSNPQKTKCHRGNPESPRLSSSPVQCRAELPTSTKQHHRCRIRRNHRASEPTCHRSRTHAYQQKGFLAPTRFCTTNYCTNMNQPVFTSTRFLTCCFSSPRRPSRKPHGWRNAESVKISQFLTQTAWRNFFRFFWSIPPCLSLPGSNPFLNPKSNTEAAACSGQVKSGEWPPGHETRKVGTTTLQPSQSMIYIYIYLYLHLYLYTDM